MKYLFILLFFTCKSPDKIEYVSSGKPVEITCVGCDSVPLGYGLLATSTVTYSIDTTIPVGKLLERIHELDDSIKLIRDQNKWLDSVNRSLGSYVERGWGLEQYINLMIPTDTVKWVPYYPNKNHATPDK